MRLQKKFMPVLVISVVGTILGLVGIALAGVQTTSVDPVSGSAESFVAATVTGEPARCLPGQGKRLSSLSPSR